MKFKKNIKFTTEIVISAMFMTFIPLIISYWIFFQDNLKIMDKQNHENIREVALSIKQAPFVQDKLDKRENDMTLQYYTQGLIQSLQDVDIIVIADMTGEKYTHLDVNQIGSIFIGDDKERVLAKGEGYYSTYEGSMGVTLRWFEPIKKNGKQVGFVMVGKYYDEIYRMMQETRSRYMNLFGITFVWSALGATLFGLRIKKAIFNMEPREIARLYSQKDSILNSVQEGIIALDSHNQIKEMNKNAIKLLEAFSKEDLLEVMDEFIRERCPLSLKEVIINHKRLFISLQPILQADEYLGVVIIMMDEQEITRVAKEITGIEEIVKDLRATVHEFKNNLHVILGLLKLEEYDQAKHYILQIQDTKIEEGIEIANIEDNYIRALLLSRKIVAKEKRVNFVITEDSWLGCDHGYISSHDLITIIGNLIENAFEATTLLKEGEKKVSLTLKETEEHVIIKVRDTGIPIEENIRYHLFEMGVSSKGENRGNGLYLVKSRIDRYKGKITIYEDKGEKQFIIIIPKEYSE